MIFRSLLVLTLFCSCAGCPPGPTPPSRPDASPVPIPGDVFAGSLLDCLGPVVQAQRAEAASPVQGCLIGTGVAACLDELAKIYRPDTVGCVARDLGASANVEVLSGDAGELPRQIADAARTWIREKGIGFK